MKFFELFKPRNTVSGIKQAAQQLKISEISLTGLIMSGAISELDAAVLKEHICSANVLIVGDPTIARKSVLFAIANEIKQKGNPLYFCSTECNLYLDNLKLYSDEKPAYEVVKSILGSNCDKTIVIDEIKSAEIALLLSTDCQWITTIQGYDSESALNNLEQFSIKNGSYIPLKSQIIDKVNLIIVVKETASGDIIISEIKLLTGWNQKLKRYELTTLSKGDTADYF